MNVLTWVHIAGGSLALLAGAVAVAARKGGYFHVRAGTLFFASMLVLGVTATVLARLDEEPDPGTGGLLTCYFVATSWVTARRRDGTTGRFEVIACAVALGTAAILAWVGLTAIAPPTPAGSGPVFALAAVCLLAGVGDLRTILRKRLSTSERISRHLWRMCFAFFIATGSFFLGQQDVMPAAVRGSPLLFVPAFAPFVVMIFWLMRIRLGRPMPFSPLHDMPTNPQKTLEEENPSPNR
jgi:Predicted membrane protein (DUF2306)